eukprot:404024_1
MQAIMLYLLFVHLTLSENIWYNPMKSASASWSGSVSYSVLSGTTDCPAGSTAFYCYHLTDPGYVDYTSSTNNPAFQRIDLTYTMKASGMSSTEVCSLLYSVDNGAVWTTIQQMTSNDQSTKTYSLSSPSADNVTALTIRLEFTGNKNHECYFNEFRLAGTRITTNPTGTGTGGRRRSEGKGGTETQIRKGDDHDNCNILQQKTLDEIEGERVQVGVTSKTTAGTGYIDEVPDDLDGVQVTANMKIVEQQSDED